MGQTVRYDIGNVYNPAYTVVCRMDATASGPPLTR
jgi:hypothetical protein